MAKVLIACEFSGVVRDAFTAAGHDAMSCDLLPTQSPGNHYQGDIRDTLDAGWDLMVAHPPCTYLARSGLHWNGRVPGRTAETEKALDFVVMLLNADIPRIALENPPGCIGTRVRPADQYIQPHQFGHLHRKMTGLWLDELPDLIATDEMKMPAAGHWENQTPSGQDKLAPSPERWMLRSVTYQGIAEAMATQWGVILDEEEKSQ